MDYQERNEQSKTNAEIIMIYQLHTDTIKQAKNQIWLTLYYTILVYAAIIGFFSMLDEKPFYMSCILTVISISVFGFGIWMIWAFFMWMHRTRKKIDLLKNYLSYPALNSLDSKIDAHNKKNSWSGFDLAHIILCHLVLYIGLKMVIWFLLCN